MQIVELSLTGVAGYPAQGRLSLGRGHVVVGSATPLLPLIRALLYFDGRPEEKVAGMAAAPGARAALMIRGRGGAAWRLVRDLRGGLLLQRFDEQEKRFGVVSESAVEIVSLLRAEVGVPSQAIFDELFSLDGERLRGWTTAALPEEMAVPLPAAPKPMAAPAIDEPEVQRRIAALERELEACRQVDELQRRLDAVLHESSGADRNREAVAAAESRASAARGALRRFESLGALPEGLAALQSGRSAADAQRDEALRRIASDRAAHESRVEAGEARPVWKDPRFIAASAVGLGALAVGLFTPLRIIALLNVPAFGVAAALGVRWVGGLQANEAASRMDAVFLERERRVESQWSAAAEPLRAALASAGVERPEELTKLAEDRARALEALAEAEADLIAVQASQGGALARSDALRREASELETKLGLLGAGAYRQRSTVERELAGLRAGLEGRAPEPTLGGGLPLALTPGGALPPGLEDALPGYREIRPAPGGPPGGGLGRQPGAAVENDPCRRLLEHAAELAAIDRHAIGAQVAPRVSEYLAALTDRRWTGVELGSVSGLRCSGAAGTAAFDALPGHDRALAWIALQLTLVELVSARQPFPLIYDEPLALFDEARQRLIGRMLQGLGARTQVIHRSRLPAVAESANAVVEAA